jgi:hypothetical protein
MHLRLDFFAGAWLWLMLFVLAGCGPGDTDHAQLPDQQAKATLATAAAAIGPAEVKTFAGSDELSVGGPLASIQLRQSDQEKKFLDDFICVDESACFGPKSFERYILTTYPEIARVRFKLPPELAEEDKEDIEHVRQDFRRGLYFAKQIRLADGRTLYDLLVKCSKSISPFNWAQVTWEPGTEKRYIAMQYFPVLRQDATGEPFELQILLKRTEDKIEALSPLFSSSVLREVDFMQKHGVSCWQPQ